MIRISERHLEALAGAINIGPVQDALANALQLELATIPPYLTALFSIKQNANRAAGALVQTVVMEEMLHLTLACNTLIAIGGTPHIAAAATALFYPGTLPLSVDDGLRVRLAALSVQQVHDVFMAIEQPDSDNILPGETAPHPPPRVPGEYASIGDFYNAIIGALVRLEAAGLDCFAHPRLDWQVDVAKWFPPTGSTYPDGKVFDLASASAALNTIIAQGEGAPVGKHYSPFDGEGAYAHYFLFGEIYHGQRLRPDAAAPSGWSYSGEAVPIDPALVYSLLENAALSDYAPGSGPAITGAQFYATYQRLLTALDTVFNGQPDALNAALGIMYELKLVAGKVMQFPADPALPAVIAAPPFMRTRAPAQASGAGSKP
jgi:hypothetical protein